MKKAYYERIEDRFSDRYDSGNYHHSNHSNIRRREVVQSDSRNIRIKEAALRRYHTVRLQKLALLIIFSLSLLIGIIFVSSKVYAGSAKSDSVKMYKSIMIYSGDTLESIATDNYCDEFVSVKKYVKEIASINNITPEHKLIPGNHIIVPYYEKSNSYNFIISLK